MKIPPNILVLGLAFALSSTQPTFGAQTAANDCLASPAPSAPKGEHWYYRINRADGRHCWYLSSQTAPAARPRLATPHVASPNPAPEAAPDVPIQQVPIQQDAQKTWPDAAFPEPPSVGATVIAGRWPDVPLPADLSSDTKRTSATDVKEDVSAAQPVVQSEEPTLLPRSEWVGIASIFLIGAVAIASLLLVRIIFRSRSRLDHVFAALGRLGRHERPHANDMAANDRGALNRPAPLRQDRMKQRAPTPTDPAQNLKASLNELMRDLQRARVADAEHSHISFAPASYR